MPQGLKQVLPPYANRLACRLRQFDPTLLPKLQALRALIPALRALRQSPQVPGQMASLRQSPQVPGQMASLRQVPSFPA